ncbi:MAG: ATP-binding protein [Pseudomonadota bacterium]|nr:ATP-binding protein [Pseudomonadota bacterium]
MLRDLLSHLKRWQTKATHLPLLLRGPRQVGKTFLIEQFGKAYFDNLVTINFEESPEYKACFDTLKPDEILAKIEVLSQQSIVPGKTLLFLDEIQSCTSAIIALRYFKEQLPALHVIGAGSLLEFALREKNMSMPVGRVQYCYLKPLSFNEYLQASDNQNLIEFLNTATIQSGIPTAIHEKALKLVREYMIIGGMPMVVAAHIEGQSLRECQEYQTIILRTYGDDFAKYAATSRHKYLQQVYNQTPGLVGEQIKYVKISPDMDSRYLKDAISDLSKAGVISPIYSTSASGLPLVTHTNEKKFKLLFLDIGILKRATRLDMELLFAEDLMLLNRGAIAEQFVGQELLAYQNPHDQPHLYYWSRDEKSSQAEVDYIINIDSKIVPIEVKSGKTGSLKSLHIFLEEKNCPLGVRISAKELSRHQNIISIPLFMINQLERLIAE